MNKKGMTLVELLAVVGILTLLLLITLPNAIKSLKSSKKSSFHTDVQTVYKTAVSQFMVDEPTATSIIYARISGEGYGDQNDEHNPFKTLELTGSTKMDYVIRLKRNTDGDIYITHYYASDHEYQYQYPEDPNNQDGNIDDVSLITIDDIKDVTELNSTEIIDIKNIIETSVTFSGTSQ